MTNIIQINYRNKIKATTVNINNNSSFEDGIIYFTSQDKKYDIFVHFLTENSAYIKPKKQYNNIIFEDLFGFGYECEGFTLNRTVYVTF